MLAIGSSLNGPRLAAQREKLYRAQHRATEVLAHLPNVPSRDDFLVEAKAMSVRCPSIDEFVDRAYERLLASVGARLAAQT